MTSRVTVSGARALVDALSGSGVQLVLGIPGVHTLPIYDALREEDSLRSIVVTHEQAAAYAADGYARVSGRPAACVVVPGPGATNLATGVATAYADSVPMIAITSTVPASYDGKSAMHECDLEGVLRPVVKAAYRVGSGGEIPAVIARAYRKAMEGRHGPVQVAIPSDLLAGEFETAAGGGFGPEEGTEGSGGPPPADLERAAAMLSAAQFPVMYAGRGVASAGAGRELVRLAERLSAPVFTSISGRGVIPEDHHLSGGLLEFPGAAELMEESDLCLAIGTAFSQLSTLRWRAPIPRRLIQVDIDGERIGRSYPVELGLVGDAGETLIGLLELIPRRSQTAAAKARLSGLREEAAKTVAGLAPMTSAGRFHPLWVVKTLRERLERDAILTTDASATETWLFEPAFPIYQPNSLLLPEVFQTMGYALPAAIGARLARPSSRVVCLSGDGSLSMSVVEVATAVHHKLPLLIVVFNDGHYNALRRFQEFFYDGRFSGVELPAIDFCRLAEGLGARGHCPGGPEEFVEALSSSLDCDGVCLINVRTDPYVMSGRLSSASLQRYESGSIPQAH